LNASVLLARSAAGTPDSNGEGLMQAAETADKQGMASAIAVYRAGAIRAAVDRGDIGMADSFWSTTASLEQKYLADPAWRRDAQLLLMAHARLSLAKQNSAAAAEKIQQAVNLVSAVHQGDDPEWRHIVALRAEIELAQHKYAAAIADARIALDRAKIEAVDPQSSAWVGEALVLRARGELALGDKAASAASAREALPHAEQNLDPSHPLISAARLLSIGDIR
jgi:hypothetical protein